MIKAKTFGFTKTKIRTLHILLFIIAVTVESPAVGQKSHRQKPLVIREQGSFAVGGTVITKPGTFDPNKPMSEDGQTIHGDHAYVFYQIPKKPRKYPLVFLHGVFQFSKTWETTPDGREGFQNIFLRRGFSTYNMNLPRRGNAGRSTLGVNLVARADEQIWFNRFRVGEWPNYYEGVQFSKDPETLNQYFRQVTPNTGPMDMNVSTDAIVKLFDKTGDAIMVCHSMGGWNTWLALPETNHIKAVVAWEPGGFLTFPNDEPVPPTKFPNFGPGIEYRQVAPEVFEKYTKIPIIIIYGDYLSTEPTGKPWVDDWGARLQLARIWAEIVNKRGGDVTVIHLPDLGFKGNTHFPMSDLNNLEMADLMYKWLKEKGLN